MSNLVRIPSFDILKDSLVDSLKYGYKPQVIEISSEVDPKYHEIMTNIFRSEVRYQSKGASWEDVLGYFFGLHVNYILVIETPLDMRYYLLGARVIREYPTNEFLIGTLLDMLQSSIDLYYDELHGSKNTINIPKLSIPGFN